MKLTLFEQSVVRLGIKTDQALQTISVAHRDQLAALSEALGLRFMSLGYNSVKFEQFVGVIRTGDLQLEILPKLDGAPSDAAVRASLVGMLGETEGLRLTKSGVSELGDESGPFIKALARLYCRELLTLVRRGLPQGYVLHHEVLPYVRGKIDWTAQAKLAVQQRAEMSCRFDDRSVDTPLNRTLKKALLIASSFLREPRSLSLVTELRHAMDGVSDEPRPTWNGRLDRLSRHLEPLTNLARLLLRGLNTDLSGRNQADDRHYALLWDMNTLFEEYVSVVATRVLSPGGIEVESQGRTHLAHDRIANRPAFPMKPDLVGFAAGSPVFVADTKWKRLDSGDHTFGVKNADVFQVVAYARRYHALRAVLVYPHYPHLGRSGIVGNYDVRDTAENAVSVIIATVDLTDLSTVDAQLRRLLGSVSKGMLELAV